MKLGYGHTRVAAYAGIFTQSIYLGLIPVLFAAFKNEFGLSYEQLGRIPLINFSLQIILDIIMVKLGDKIKLRTLAVVSNVLGIIGLILLSVLPRLMSGAPYAALMISTVFLAIGCGLIDLAINPVINALPSGKNRAELPLLHSFFCFGCVFTFLTATLFVHFAGTDRWYLLPLFMAFLPLFDLIAFIFVPIIEKDRKSKGETVKKKFFSFPFIILMLMMICAGSSEQAVSSWISLFAELGLSMPKLVGDIVGLCGFSACMAAGRMLFGLFGGRLNMKKALFVSALCCAISYLGITLSPSNTVSLIFCAVTGFSVAIMWPGVLSIASDEVSSDSVPMFSMLAVCGDVGCSAGPWLIGIVSDAVDNGSVASPLTYTGSEVATRTGILAAVFFPVLMTVLGILLLRKNKNIHKGEKQP
ncbi:MAG: MFS transporter [Clostridia bacterium]|nr:MFS transporter [Clostridia bacterium]